MIRNNNGQSPFNPSSGPPRTASEGTRSVSTGNTARSSSQSSASSSASSPPSRAEAAKRSGLKKEAAKLLAQGVTNGLVGAFTRGGAALIKNLAGDATYGKDGHKLLEHTRTGRRLEQHQERGEAKMHVGAAQLKAGLSAVFGKKITAQQLARIADAKAGDTKVKQQQAYLEKDLQSEKTRKRADATAAPGEAAYNGHGSRRLQKYEEYGS